MQTEFTEDKESEKKIKEMMVSNVSKLRKDVN